MHESLIAVFGLGGDALTTPENTIEAYWMALGGGAAGLAVGVRLSRDGVVVCSEHDDFGPTCDDERAVAELDWRDIRRLDAGSTFCSTVLGADRQPTGERGGDRPWLGNLPSKRAVRVARLSDVLRLFGRRAAIIVGLPDGDRPLAEATVAELRRFGLLGRILLAGSRETCTALSDMDRGARCVLVGDVDAAPADQVAVARALGAAALWLDWDAACPADAGRVAFDADLAAALDGSHMQLLLGSDRMPFAASPAHFAALDGIALKFGIVARGVLPTVDELTPASLVADDRFEGTRIDRGLWAAGYSHPNQDTEIFQDDGLHIRIRAGGSYSGAAAICTLPVHGRFDAHTAFYVGNPRAATTFELAAICIDPGYHDIDNSNPDRMRVNLTFDVHGAPPYASSERDEDDGFRCGWNNGFSLTRIGEDWSASSVNMYNKYGRDVGDGGADNPEGQLRLVRNGSIFACYYTDRHNAAWVGSGAMLVQSIAEDVYLRLAAKHWSKGGTPPDNHVRFHDFRLYQF